MILFEVLPTLAVMTTVLFVVLRVRGVAPPSWVLPASLSAGFLLFSLWVVAIEGPFGFVANHIQNGWGNQVWFDLLLAVSMSLVFLVPAAKRVGMNVVPWAVFVCLTASIGLFAMLARVMYLEARETASGVPDPA